MLYGISTTPVSFFVHNLSTKPNGRPVRTNNMLYCSLDSSMSPRNKLLAKINLNCQSFQLKNIKLPSNGYPLAKLSAMNKNTINSFCIVTSEY